MNIKKRKGFSYIEVIFIIIILSILATLAFSYYQGFKPDTELSSKQMEASSMTSAVADYIQVTGKAPTLVPDVDYKTKPALLDISKLRDDMNNNKMVGHYYIYGPNNEVFYDYPTPYIESVFEKYKQDKGNTPFKSGTKEVDMNTLYQQGYIDIIPLTSFLVQDDGNFKQITLTTKINVKGTDVSLTNTNKPSMPVILPSKDTKQKDMATGYPIFSVNDALYFVAESSYQKGEIVSYSLTDETNNPVGLKDGAKIFSLGTHTITARATASDGKISDPSMYTFKIIANNRKPSVSAINITPALSTAKPSYNSNDVLSFQAIATDPENDVLTFKWLGITANGKYSKGTHTISVYAQDTAGNVSDTYKITFKVENSPPVVLRVNPSRTPIYFDTIVTFTATIKDPDGDLADYEIISGLTPDNKYPVGDHTIKVVAKDSYGAVSQPFSYDFTSFNKPISNPTLIMSPNSSTDLRSNTTIDFAATGSVDPLNDTFAYYWTVDGGDKTLTEPDGKYTVGDHTVTVQAIGAKGNSSDVVTVNFTVNNTAPTTPSITMQPASNTDLRSNTNITFNKSVSTDLDNDPITYEWKVDSNPWSTNDPSGKYGVGTHSVMVRAKDSRGSYSNSSSISFSINNTPPTQPNIDMTPDPSIPTTDIRSDDNVTFAISNSTDIDGDTISYRWVVDGQAPTATTPNGKYTVGNHSITLTATDSRGAVAPSTTINFKVNNTEPTTPVISMSPLSTADNRSNTNITFNRTNATDIDGDTITYQWDKDDTGWSTTAPNGTFLVGEHIIKLRAVDSRGGISNIDTLTFTINNTAPTIPTASMNPTSNTDIRSYTNISFSANSTDLDGDLVTIEWNTDNKGWSASIPNGMYTIGNHTVEVRSKDARGTYSSSNVTLSFTVNNTPPTQPSLTMTPDSTSDIRSNTNISFGSSASDADNDTLVYEWNVDNNGWNTTNPNGKFDVGDHSVQVRVKDTYGATSPINSVSFTVNNTVPTDPTLTMSPITNLKSKTSLTFEATASDLDNDNLTYEWSIDDSIWSTTSPNGMYPVGIHKVSVKVKDSRDAYSQVSTVIFEIVNSTPTDPTITMSPDTSKILTVDDTISFGHTTSVDDDGDVITYEWNVDNQGWTTTDPTGKYAIGDHRTELRAKDSRNAYTNLNAVNFHVSDNKIIITNFSEDKAVPIRYQSVEEPANSGEQKGQTSINTTINNFKILVQNHPTDNNMLRLVIDADITYHLQNDFLVPPADMSTYYLNALPKLTINGVDLPATTAPDENNNIEQDIKYNYNGYILDVPKYDNSVVLEMENDGYFIDASYDDPKLFSDSPRDFTKLTRTLAFY